MSIREVRADLLSLENAPSNDSLSVGQIGLNSSGGLDLGTPTGNVPLKSHSDFSLLKTDTFIVGNDTTNLTIAGIGYVNIPQARSFTNNITTQSVAMVDGDVAYVIPDRGAAVSNPLTIVAISAAILPKDQDLVILAYKEGGVIYFKDLDTVKANENSRDILLGPSLANEAAADAYFTIKIDGLVYFDLNLAQYRRWDNVGSVWLNLGGSTVHDGLSLIGNGSLSFVKDDTDVGVAANLIDVTIATYTGTLILGGVGYDPTGQVGNAFKVPAANDGLKFEGMTIKGAKVGVPASGLVCEVYGYDPVTLERDVSPYMISDVVLATSVGAAVPSDIPVVFSGLNQKVVYKNRSYIWLLKLDDGIATYNAGNHFTVLYEVADATPYLDGDIVVGNTASTTMTTQTQNLAFVVSCVDQDIMGFTLSADCYLQVPPLLNDRHTIQAQVIPMIANDRVAYVTIDRAAAGATNLTVKDIALVDFEADGNNIIIARRHDDILYWGVRDLEFIESVVEQNETALVGIGQPSKKYFSAPRRKLVEIPNMSGLTADTTLLSTTFEGTGRPIRYSLISYRRSGSNVGFISINNNSGSTQTLNLAILILNRAGYTGNTDNFDAKTAIGGVLTLANNGLIRVTPPSFVDFETHGIAGTMSVDVKIEFISANMNFTANYMALLIEEI